MFLEFESLAQNVIIKKILRCRSTEIVIFKLFYLFSKLIIIIIIIIKLFKFYLISSGVIQICGFRDSGGGDDWSITRIVGGTNAKKGCNFAFNLCVLCYQFM